MERNRKVRKEVVSKTQEVWDDFIAWEILSRLPVKSLMRFKCVCKRWQSMIQKDQFFIGLHSSRSITTTKRTSFLLIDKYRMYVLSAELLLPSNEEDGCVEVGTICRWEPPILQEHRTEVCILNGLICFMAEDGSCACVYNCSTRESTPWIQSIIKKQEDNSFKQEELSIMKHELGYDPATKEYKVVALWNLRDDLVCEVLTVRQNSWRRIDGIRSFPLYYVSSVYVNGCIYFLCDHDDAFIESIVEFNVGSEKLRIVATIDSELRVFPIEFNGRLCMLSYETQGEEYRPTKMYILYDHNEDVQDNKGKMTTNSNYQWVERTLSLPHQLLSPCSARHVPGTNLFIIRSLDEGLSFYHDNQQNKCYSFSKINNDISTILGLQRCGFEFGTFTPNLLSVN